MGIMDRIKKAHEAKLDHMKALVHGNSGSGKSTICATLPRPILYAYTEPQGVVSFRRLAPDEDTVHIKSVDDVRDLLVTLRNGERNEAKGTLCGYRSLAFDSLTEMQRKIMDQYVDRSDGGEKTGERISISNWGEIIDRTAQLVRSFRNLPLHFVITTLSAEQFVGSEDDKRRVVRPELSGRTLPNTLAQFFNLVGYAYTRENKDAIDYRVLLGGNVDFLTKGMPGLSYREIPDVSYWIERSFNNCDPIDPEAPMFPWPTAGNYAREKVQEILDDIQESAKSVAKRKPVEDNNTNSASAPESEPKESKDKDTSEEKPSDDGAASAQETKEETKPRKRPARRR